ncbi:MAG TPA: universal stress protein [Candidatus Limnocylindrales bacterium]|nr:universal stress protein [Candidatus Limnocylindrales bacterium]
MYSKILVPLDGSSLAEQILPYVRSLAAAYNVPVELLWVNDVENAEWPPRSGKEYLRQTIAKYLSALKRIASIEANGRPAEEIVRRAGAEPSCLIAMATHGMSGVRRWLIGSVASKVAQLAQNPLLLVRPIENADLAAAIELKTIFVPLDGSGLAEKALPHAVALAKGLNLAVQLLRVYALPSDAYIVADGVIGQGAAPFREAMQKEAANYLEGKVETLRGEGLAEVIGTAMEGDPPKEIIDLAAKTANSLIVMSTHGRSGIGRWMLGSVAEKIIQHSRAPVLLIRAG